METKVTEELWAQLCRLYLPHLAIHRDNLRAVLKKHHWKECIEFLPVRPKKIRKGGMSTAERNKMILKEYQALKTSGLTNVSDIARQISEKVKGVEISHQTIRKIITTHNSKEHF